MPDSSRLNRPALLVGIAIASLGSVALLLGLSVLAFTSIASSGQLYNVRALEARITASFAKQSSPLTDVQCPAHEHLTKDVVFQCSGTDSNGVIVLVAVHVENANGSVTWQPLQPYSEKALEAQIVGYAAQQSVALTHMMCPAKELLKKGRTFTCTAMVIGGPAVDFTVRVNDSLGGMTWVAKAASQSG